MGEFFQECRTRYLMLSSSRSLKILRRSSLLNSTISDGLYSFFSEFPSFTRNIRPQKSSSNVLECQVHDSIVLEIFPTRYSTRLDSIFVEEVWPSANSPMAGVYTLRSRDSRDCGFKSCRRLFFLFLSLKGVSLIRFLKEVQRY